MTGSISGVTLQKRGGDVDMIMFQGATVSFGLIWGGSTPIDVTGFGARMTIKSNDLVTTIAEFTVAGTGVNNGTVTIGGVDGSIEFGMTATDSANLTVGDDYRYDIEIVEADTVTVHRVASGCLEVSAEVTT